jgi:hypothetical protein
LGTANTERIADHIHVMSIAADLNLLWNTSATTAADHVRVALIVDRQADGDYPDETGEEGIYESNSVTSYRDRENMKRFGILKTWKVSLSTDRRFAKLRMYRTFRKPIVVSYKGTTNVEASNGQNAMYLGYLSTAATNAPTLTGDIRLKYHD